MAERKGRVTIGDDGYVIGSGGNVNANECIVENRSGNVIGTTFAQEAKDAWSESRKLRYQKKWCAHRRYKSEPTS